MLRQVFAIAITTFRELVRSKVLYVALFFSAALVLVAALFGTVTIGDQAKVIKDFGLFSISICLVGFSVISGSALLAKELSKKTIYNLLAKPVSRGVFLWGKYLGMLSTALMMLVCMGGALSIFLFMFEPEFDALMFVGYFFVALELVLVCALAMMFSSVVVTPLLSGLFTFGVFLAGRSTSYLVFFIEEGQVSGSLARFLRALYWAVPNFDLLNMANDLVYGRVASISTVAWCSCYVFGYAIVLLLAAQLLFARREFN